MGSSSVSFLGDPRGVMDDADNSFLLTYRECLGVTFRSGASVNSDVSYVKSKEAVYSLAPHSKAKKARYFTA